MDDMKRLEALEALAKSAGGDGGRLAKQQDEAAGLYARRVAQLAEEHGVAEARAHGLAASDDLAKRAYALSVGLGERRAAAQDLAHGLGAHLG